MDIHYASSSVSVLASTMSTRIPRATPPICTGFEMDALTTLLGLTSALKWAAPGTSSRNSPSRLGVSSCLHDADASDIAVGSVEAGNEPRCDWITTCLLYTSPSPRDG